MKRISRISIIGIICTIGILVSLSIHRKQPPVKIVTLRSRNLTFQVETRVKTVSEVLKEQGYDPSVVAIRHNLRSGATIEISRPVRVVINDGGDEKFYNSSAATVNDLLREQKIDLADTDRVSAFISTPSSSPPYQGGERVGVFLADGMIIKIDRIVTLPVVETHEIPFTTRFSDDPENYYGRETVIAAGQPGLIEQNFLITYKNGVEIKRKLLSETVLEKPVTEERDFGTKIEIEETREGRASWYAYKGCLCAAHPFYDKGRYVRVIALATGQSVIVRINDRGPELDKHPDRVIDLDSVAFKQLATLGSGTIGVKVELLKN